jgi:glycosyltransferase involved in cell wall biosynthesis
MNPVGIVIPWFGADLRGGAEQQAFQIATRVAARGHAVEVLTTCNRSFNSDWDVNHHDPGVSEEKGVIIRRFLVANRDASAFDQVNAKLLALDRLGLRPGISPMTPLEAQTFIHETIKSPDLLAYLQENRDRYHAFIFLPYMFSASVLGIPLVADRAWLQPCLHDEPAAYLPEIAEMFQDARGLLFNSTGELELALRLYGPGIYPRSAVVGEGIEQSSYTVDESEAALPAQLRGARFVLYLGRRDRTKNVDLLVNSFARFRTARPNSDLQLVVAGPGTKSFADDSVHDLGEVSRKMKAALLAYCLALAQPSRNESFSRAMMEAWSLQRPVVAHRECLATARAVKESSGGWLAGDENEWAEAFAHLDSIRDRELKRFGALGRAYAKEYADWNKVIPRYETLLELPPSSTVSVPRKARAMSSKPNVAVASRSKTPRAIHQLLPDIVYGDAISNHALAIRNHLRQAGHESQIFVNRREKRMAAEAVLWKEAQPLAADALLYHHSIGSELTAFAAAHRGPKCLIYHNITPANYFAPYRPGFAWMLEVGRAQLPMLARYFPMSAGVSSYNAGELSDCGFRAPAVLPIIIDPDRWNIAPDETKMARLQDGRTNLLFVGRIAPNKQQVRLIKAFSEYRKLQPNSRLILAGEDHAFDPYYQEVRATIERLGLTGDVELTGRVEDASLLAYYRTANLYWSFSAHEGFGTPLIEAMWFDIPVLALRAAAVPETLGPAGIVFDPDTQTDSIINLAFRLTDDLEFRAPVIAAQRERRLCFTSSAVHARLANLAKHLLARPGTAARAHSGKRRAKDSE